MSKQATLGILLTNLGTPVAPTTAALRHYLAEFLADPRVVELPRWLWRLILHGIVLRVRPKRSAASYHEIWTPEGSPLLAYSQKLALGLEEALQQQLGSDSVKVKLAMRYGQPAIAEQLKQFSAVGIHKILIFPLYPQYAAATTASTYDAVFHGLKTQRYVPELRFINSYAEHPSYIQAWTAHLQAHWQQHGRAEHLLFSFHGLPKRCVELGDPYAQQCYATAHLLADALHLTPDSWGVVFQSRFGFAPWLQPYCDQTLVQLAQQGKKIVEVICPGFAVDCLETLEEIAQRYAKLFQQAGGGKLIYVPALNAASTHITALAQIACPHLKEWVK